MPASLALDGKQGKSPLVKALLSWLQRPDLLKRKVLDPEVTNHVTRMVQEKLPSFLLPRKGKASFLPAACTMRVT